MDGSLEKLAGPAAWQVQSVTESCSLYDVGSDYPVMEYVDGAAIKGSLPVEEAARLAIQIAGALDEAHTRGILHWDLKPGNTMVTASGSVKLLAFGLAKVAVGTESETASTMEGTVVGTPAYTSPEQTQGNPVDARSDKIIAGVRPVNIGSQKEFAMPRNTKPGAVKWTEKLDKTKVREAFEEAVIDAHDEYEQHSGLLTMIENEVKFPFRAKALGEFVTVVAMEWPEDDEFGLDFVCERNVEQHRIEARSVDLVPPLPDGHMYIAAYLDWKRGL